MRFLLFIAFALLPLSIALKCYEGKEYFIDGKLHAGKSIIKVPKDCATNCLGIFAEDTVNKLRMDELKCAEENFCEDMKLAGKSCISMGDKIPMEQCCCNGDLCNESKTTALAHPVPTPTASVKCYIGNDLRKADGSPAPNSVPMTEAGCMSGYCVLILSEENGISGARRFCADKSQEGFCVERKVFGAMKDGCTPGSGGTGAEVCCCQSNLCNESKATIAEKSKAKTPAPADNPSAPSGNPSAPSENPSAPSGNPSDPAQKPSIPSGNSSASAGGSKSEEASPAAVPTLLLSLAAAAAIIGARL